MSAEVGAWAAVSGWMDGKVALTGQRFVVARTVGLRQRRHVRYRPGDRSTDVEIDLGDGQGEGERGVR